MTAWAEPEDTGGFGIAALPYGVLEAPGGPRVVVTRRPRPDARASR